MKDQQIKNNTSSASKAAILKKTTDIASAAVTVALGMASTNKGELAKLGVSTGKMILKRDFNKALVSTYNFFMSKGTLNESYFDSPEWADLSPEFDIINENNFGKDKLDYLRKIFANLALNPKDTKQKYLLDIALNLSEPQIKILIADFQKAQLPTPLENSEINIRRWQEEIAAQSGLEHAELVALNDKTLIDMKLINAPFMHASNSTSVRPGRSRLTDLGFALCDLMILEDDPIERI